MLGPVLRWPGHPVRMARFGLRAGLPATVLAARFRTPQARALFAGSAAHVFRPLNRPATASVGVMLTAAGHVHGWPVPEGGSTAITRALASLLAELGGTVVTGHRVRSRADLPAARVTLFDTGPETVAEVYGDALPGRTRRAYRRYRHGPAAFKVDLAVRGGVPWTNEAARRAGTVHVGGTLRGDRRGRGGGLRRAGCRSGRSSSSPSSRWPTRRRAGWATCTRSGPTRTCRPAGTGRGSRWCSTSSSGSRPGCASGWWRPRCVRRPTSRPTTPTTSAATSPAAPTTCASSWPGPRLAADPYATGLPGVYLCSAATPAGRGRARHVRLPRGHPGAALAARQG